MTEQSLEEMYDNMSVEEYFHTYNTLLVDMALNLQRADPPTIKAFLDVLGIDSNITVAELRRNNLLAERVQGLSTDDKFPWQIYDPRYGRWIHQPVDMLRWITRPNEDPSDVNNMYGYPEI